MLTLMASSSSRRSVSSHSDDTLPIQTQTVPPPRRRVAGAEMPRWEIGYPLAVALVHFLIVQIAATLANLNGTSNSPSPPYRQSCRRFPPVSGITSSIRCALGRSLVSAHRGPGLSGRKQYLERCLLAALPMSMRGLSRVTGLQQEVSGYLIANVCFCGGNGAALPTGAGRFRYPNRAAHDLGARPLSRPRSFSPRFTPSRRSSCSAWRRSSARAFASGGWLACWVRWQHSRARTVSSWSFPLRCSGSSRTVSIYARRSPRDSPSSCHCWGRSRLAPICNMRRGTGATSSKCRRCGIARLHCRGEHFSAPSTGCVL